MSDVKSMNLPHLVTARFYEHIEPLDRGTRYEDPLDAVLKPAGLGAVAGGGSQLNELGGIDFAEVEIQLADLNGLLRMTVEALELAGAPEGSEILYGATVIREFGTRQCVAVYLDGVSLPDEVYADLDFDELLATLGNAAGPDSYRGFWQGPQETGLFYFGPNADELFARIEPALLGLPIGQNARVVVRAGKPGLPSRTVRMPRA